MARGRRRKVSSRRKERADWVYRDDGQQLTLGGSSILTTDNLGTYSPSSVVISSEDRLGLILYDSRNYLHKTTSGGTGPFGALRGAARAEGRRAKCLVVEGLIVIDTSSWAVNNELVAGFRIGVFEQSPSLGTLALDGAYSMFQQLGEQPPTVFANYGRGNLWERRVYKSFNDSNTGGIFTLAVKTRFRVSLAAHECLGIYLELDTGSVNARETFWLRTLVVDEG